MDDSLLNFNPCQDLLPFPFALNDVIPNLDTTGILDNSNFDSGSIVDPNYNMALIPLASLDSTTSAVQINDDSAFANVNYTPSSLPASQSWPGIYDFNVSFALQEKNTKGIAWTYSKMKDKLYVGKDVPCPINFSANSVLPDNVKIRALPLYSSPEHTSEVVRRCAGHTLEESKKGVFEAAHLVRCESNMAAYEIDITTGHQSVKVPFENPPAGQEYSTYIYKFTCFGSCAGGPNRRPLMLIFTLEKEGQVIGRHKLDVKICSCPGRDRKNEESSLAENKSTVKKRKNEEAVNLAEILDVSKLLPLTRKKSKHQPGENGVFSVKTTDSECYHFLKQMKTMYKVCKALNVWSSKEERHET